MKSKKEKLAILDNLIERAEQEQYGVKGEMHILVMETDMFMRNCAGKDVLARWENYMLGKIHFIRAAQNQIGEYQRLPNRNDSQWKDFPNQQEQAWLQAKREFIDSLICMRKEIEMYYDDESDTYDDEKSDTYDNPFGAIRQLLELFEEIYSTVGELKIRIDDLESRIEDMQAAIDNLECN